MNRQKIIIMKIKVMSKTLMKMRTKIVKKKMKKMNWLNKTKKEPEESKGDKQDGTSPNNPVDDGENKSDELMQAEAVLNALKDQEKINQKQKILKTKSLKFDKDW